MRCRECMGVALAVAATDLVIARSAYSRGEKKSRSYTVMPPVRIERGDATRIAEDEERSRQPGTKANPDEQKRQEHKSSPPSKDEYYRKLGQARRNYVRQVARALKGRRSSLFNVEPMREPVYDAAKSNVSSAVVEMGANSHAPAMTMAMKEYDDQVSASLFEYPTTDILAYRRRIEQPRVFSHSPVFGF